MTAPVRKLLEYYTNDTLAAILGFHKQPLPTPRNKKELVQALSRLFANPEWPKIAFGKLTAAEREVVYTLQRNDGQASLKTIERELYAHKLAKRPQDNRAYYYGFKPDLEAAPSRTEEVLARLLAWGLVFADYETSSRASAKGALGFNVETNYLIAEEALRRLPPPPQAAVPPPLATVTVERILESSARAFQREIFLYWSFVQEAAIPLLGKGLLPKKSLVALNAILMRREEIGTGHKETDFPRLVFLRSLLTRLGLLIETQAGELKAVPDPEFLTRPPDERLRRTFDAYVSGDITNELAWLPDLKIPPGAAPRLPTPAPVAGARRLLLEYLKRAAGWASLPAFTEQIRDLEFDFLLPRGFTRSEYRYYGYAVRSPYTEYGNALGWEFKVTADGEHGWMQVEGSFIQNVIQGPLYWMGLVDLGFTGPGLEAPDAFRLTPAGAWLLGTGPKPEMPVEGGQVIVQPNFQIMAFDPVSDAVLVDLNRFAERVSAERVAEFRLTRASVYAGQKNGWDARRIRSYLETLTGSPLPENVFRTLDEWQALHDRIRIYPRLSLVHAAGPEDLEQLASDPQLGRFLGRRFAPGLAHIRDPKAVTDLVHRLFQREQLPLVSGDSQGIPPRSVSVREEPHRLVLKFTVPTPDLFLHGHLARFSVLEGDHYLLTAESVRRAVAAGLDAPQILVALAEVLEAPLPEKAARRIRAWAGHYGSANLEETILISLQNETALQELMSDPEVGPLLRAVRPGDAARMARIRPRDLDRLRALLEERGISIRG